MNLYEKKFTVEKIRPGTQSVISSNNFYFKRLENGNMQIQFSIDKGEYTPVINIDLNQSTGKNYTIIPTNLNEGELYYLIYIDLYLVLKDAVSKSYITPDQRVDFSPAINTFNIMIPPQEIGGKYEKIVKEITPVEPDKTPVEPNKPPVAESSSSIYIGIGIGVLVLIVIIVLLYHFYWKKKNKGDNYLELSKI